MNYNIFIFSTIFFFALAILFRPDNGYKPQRAVIIIARLVAWASSIYIVVIAVLYSWFGLFQSSSSPWLFSWFTDYALWFLPLAVLVGVLTYLFRKKSWLGISISLLAPLLLQVIYQLLINYKYNDSSNWEYFILHEVILGRGWQMLAFSLAVSIGVLSVIKRQWFKIYYLLIWFAIQVVAIVPVFTESLDQNLDWDRHAVFYSGLIDLKLLFTLSGFLQVSFILVAEKIHFGTRRTPLSSET